MKTLKGTSNLEAIHSDKFQQNIGVTAQSTLLNLRVQELTRMEKSYYELSKKEHEAGKQRFQDSIQAAEPTGEIMNGSEGGCSYTVQVISELQENKRIKSTENDFKLGTTFDAILKFKFQMKRTDELKRKLSRNEARALALERSLEERENQLQELKYHVRDLQNKKDNLALSNINLMLNVHKAKQEVREYDKHVSVYLSINEGLIVLAQSKDREVKSLQTQLACLHGVLSGKSKENINLRNALEALRKEIHDLRHHQLILEQHYELTKLKLLDMKKEFIEHETALAKVNRYLTRIVENHDSLLAESQQLCRQLHGAKNKEFQLEIELRYSGVVVSDLKEKLCPMQNEMYRLTLEMKEIRSENLLLMQTREAKGHDLLILQNEMVGLWQRVQDLEEELMEKEGQIVILKRSFAEDVGY